MFKKLSLFIFLFAVSCGEANTSYHSYSTSALPSSSTKATHYLVKKGDSLWKISRKYGVSVKTIMRKNRMSSPKNLKVGQKILIPTFATRKIAGGAFLWPVKGQVVNFFGETVNNSTNKGLNIKTNNNAKGVLAAADGQVVFANTLKGWGKTVMMKHSSGFYTIYANLDSSLIKEGVFVKKGRVVGNLASNRNGDCILHFEIRKRHLPQNPLSYLN